MNETEGAYEIATQTDFSVEPVVYGIDDPISIELQGMMSADTPESELPINLTDNTSSDASLKGASSTRPSSSSDLLAVADKPGAGDYAMTRSRSWSRSNQLDNSFASFAEASDTKLTTSGSSPLLRARSPRVSLSPTPLRNRTEEITRSVSSQYNAIVASRDEYIQTEHDISEDSSPLMSGSSKDIISTPRFIEPSIKVTVSRKSTSVGKSDGSVNGDSSAVTSQTNAASSRNRSSSIDDGAQNQATNANILDVGDKASLRRSFSDARTIQHQSNDAGVTGSSAIDNTASLPPRVQSGTPRLSNTDQQSPRPPLSSGSRSNTPRSARGDSKRGDSTDASSRVGVRKGSDTSSSSSRSKPPNMIDVDIDGSSELGAGSVVSGKPSSLHRNSVEQSVDMAADQRGKQKPLLSESQTKAMAKSQNLRDKIPRYAQPLQSKLIGDSNNSSREKDDEIADPRQFRTDEDGLSIESELDTDFTMRVRGIILPTAVTTPSARKITVLVPVYAQRFAKHTSYRASRLAATSDSYTSPEMRANVSSLITVKKIERSTNKQPIETAETCVMTELSGEDFMDKYGDYAQEKRAIEEATVIEKQEAIKEINDVATRNRSLLAHKAQTNWKIFTRGMHSRELNRQKRLKDRQSRRVDPVVQRILYRSNEAINKLKTLREMIEAERRRNIERVLQAVQLAIGSRPPSRTDTPKPSSASTTPTIPQAQGPYVPSLRLQISSSPRAKSVTPIDYQESGRQSKLSTNSVAPIPISTIKPPPSSTSRVSRNVIGFDLSGSSAYATRGGFPAMHSTMSVKRGAGFYVEKYDSEMDDDAMMNSTETKQMLSSRSRTPNMRMS
eukprot:TRINITY_DN8896_c0_g1_i2.p1 TRINITY_DN8896_c0_g1~~TRINITY_DN8896_c0_g1_i2.p1  ORF type:complete len:842 (+),score=158.28 TRINITY_DN8896_c0_g1_i2:164-2689(+)